MRIGYYFTLVLLGVASMVSNLKGDNLFNQPESVTYDSERGYYLVSNKGNGEIIKLAGEEQSVWNSDQQSIRGLHILGDKLYAASNEGLIGFDLATGEKVSSITLNGQAFLNDIASDSNGYLYISDTGGGKIFKVNPTTSTQSVFATGLPQPNGILFEEDQNRLLVCNWGSTGIVNSVSLADSTVSIAFNTDMVDMDGIIFNDGDYVISAWSPSTINVKPQNSDEFVSFPLELNGPADISNNGPEGIMIPYFSSNEVKSFSYSLSIGEDEITPKSFKLKQNYPNPFNPETTIEYQIFDSSKVNISIYDQNGSLVENLVDRNQGEGSYTIKWNGEGKASGTYYYRIDVDGEISFKKCSLIK